jgi:hypothetical protein
MARDSSCAARSAWQLKVNAARDRIQIEKTKKAYDRAGLKWMTCSENPKS